MFAYTAGSRWEPGIGDPTVMGWVTVAAYFIAAFLCSRTARQLGASAPAARGPRLFWWLLTICLALLGLNKQLDLQTWFTLFGKHLALDEGWYEQRRAVQVLFVALVAVGGVAALFGLRRLAGTLTAHARLALAGLVFLGAFILVRASSFHHVDQFLGWRLASVKMNWLLELGGIGGIGLAAWLASRAMGKSSPQTNSTSGAAARGGSLRRRWRPRSP